MKSSGKILALMGGMMLGAILGSVVVIGFTVVLFPEPQPTESHKQEPGDWIGGSIDLIEAGAAGFNYLVCILISGALGSIAGGAGGLVLALRATRDQDEPQPMRE